MSQMMELKDEESKLPSQQAGLSSVTSDSDVDTEFSPEAQKKILRRIDRRLVVTAGVMYCTALIDRANLATANIAGMSSELHLFGNRYAVATLVFFLTYIAFQPPSPVILRKVGPRLHVSAITVLFGAVVIGIGFTRRYEQLVALRVILGMLEAGTFPSFIYLISTWYTRYEVGKRFSIFAILGAVTTGCSGILAFGLTKMDGLCQLSGWRWIFIVEGIFTCLVGLGGYWLLVDFPDSPRKSWGFLNARELAWVIKRVDADRGDAVTPSFEVKKFLAAGLDLKIWVIGILVFLSATIHYSLGFFLPIILHRNLGFSVGASQCLSAPPNLFAGACMFATSWLGDRYRVRGPFIALNLVACLVGLPVLGWAPSGGARYVGAFLIAGGALSNIPLTMAYQANNVRGQWKRAFSSATLVAFSGLGGVSGSLLFRPQDEATGYKFGFYACIICGLASLVILGLLDLFFFMKNRQADRTGMTLEDDEAGGKADFRYTL